MQVAPRNPRRNEPPRNDYGNREQDRPYNENPRESSDYGRMRPQQRPVPLQRNDRRNPSDVLAVEQAPTPDATNPGELSTVEQKHAHIGAFIERNNALAVCT
ncbi:hypothetical protein Aduo_018714 [Ancylostoma duodenale]